MGTNVFANNFEISSKAASGMTAGAMPDPCFTPPPTPAGVEVVIPYPNTAKASDLDKGSSKVKICNKEAALEDTSHMKTSMGNEAAKASTMQGGVVTKTTKGKVFFVKWSSDVKFEGKGVCRHIDMTTHNHGSKPGHCVPTPYMDMANIASACDAEKAAIDAACKGEESSSSENAPKNMPGKSLCKGLMLKPTSKNAGEILNAACLKSVDEKYIYKSVSKNRASNVSKAAGMMAQQASDNACLKKMRCKVHEFDKVNKGASGSDGNPLLCCPGQTGHHIIPDATKMPSCWPAYATGPVICVEGYSQTHGTHGMIHRNLTRSLGAAKTMSCHDVINICAASVGQTFADCSTGCIEAQLKEGKNCESCEDKNTETKVSSGYTGKPACADYEKC